jgi:hypothetical protein
VPKLDVFTPSGCGVENKWNQMRFRAMIFADGAVFGRARRVEIAKGAKRKSSATREIAQRVFRHRVWSGP